MAEQTVSYPIVVGTSVSSGPINPGVCEVTIFWKQQSNFLVFLAHAGQKILTSNLKTIIK